MNIIGVNEKRVHVRVCMMIEMMIFFFTKRTWRTVKVFFVCYARGPDFRAGGTKEKLTVRGSPNNGWDSASLVTLCSTCLLIKITFIAHRSSLIERFHKYPHVVVTHHLIEFHRRKRRLRTINGHFSAPQVTTTSACSNSRARFRRRKTPF